MTSYEMLEQDAHDERVQIVPYDLGERLKGLYCDGTIALNIDINTQAEKTCVLAEELGHHYTTTGNILDQSQSENRKQELHARLHGYNRLIGLNGIIRAYQHRCQNLAEMAEYLEVTETFLKEALELYRQKYGTGVEIDNYIVIFEPQLAVMEKIL